MIELETAERETEGLRAQVNNLQDQLREVRITPPEPTPAPEPSPAPEPAPAPKQRGPHLVVHG